VGFENNFNGTYFHHHSNFVYKVENIFKGSLDLIPSPSTLVKIQIMGRKIGLRRKGKTLQHCNKLFCKNPGMFCIITSSKLLCQ
jgi:hypothetical protein